MKRTVLYYPAISIPDGPWLRRALFYFDEIASIVPSTLYFSGELGPSLVPVSDEVLFLESQKAFRRIAPDNLWLRPAPKDQEDDANAHPTEDWSKASDFAGEFIGTVDRLGFHGIPHAEDANTQRLHRGKLAHMVLPALEQRGLARLELDSQQIPTEWLLVEKRTARLYMAMLAQHMADLDGEDTVPGTDSIEDENLIYQAPVGDGFCCIETRFLRAVPAPRDDVSLDDILVFKRRREAELLAYRERVDELQSALSEAESNAAAKHALVRFEESQRKELMNVMAAMADSGIATVLGSLKTLVKATRPAFWGAAAAAVAPVAPPLSVAFAGMAAGSAVEGSAYLVDRRNEKRANKRKFAFSYVLHAKKERLL